MNFIKVCLIINAVLEFIRQFWDDFTIINLAFTLFLTIFLRQADCQFQVDHSEIFSKCYFLVALHRLSSIYFHWENHI